MILIIVIVVYCLNFTEGFEKEEPIPDYCGSAGYTMHPESKKIIHGKDAILNREYTQSECDKIDGAKFKNGQCTLTKNGKEINCNETCKGLNKIKSLPPSDCSVDEKLLGITNKPFKLKFNGKTITIPENTMRFYTSNECEQLNGKHDISILTMMNDKEREQFTKDHGNGYGDCKKDNIFYSRMCYADPPSVTDVKNKLSGLFS